MTYKPTESKYVGKTETRYLVWHEPKEYRGGVKHRRVYVKRFYVSGKLVSVSKIVRDYKNKAGGITRGVKVIYMNPVSGFKGKRGKLKGVRVKRKRIKITQIVPLEGARVGAKVKVTKHPPRGPLMDIR